MDQLRMTEGGPSGNRGVRRKSRLGLGAASLGALLAAWLLGLAAVRPLEAQQGRPAGHVRFEYRQDQAIWSNMAEVLNRWEARGWETFQIVPVQASNPGVGGPMQVALVFRRVVK